MSKLSIYLKSILLPVVLGGIVGFIISGFMNYNMLQKPPFAPPAILFPIVWTILYVLMGVSYGTLKSKGKTNDKINNIYYEQLFINLLWPIFFFVLDWRLFSFVWIILLVIVVIKMIIEFYKEDKIAGLLQIPYLIWLLFASYLNLSFYLLNR